MHRTMIGISVAASRLLSGQGTKNTSFMSLSSPPKTHWPSTWRPLLYLRFPNLDSSISTTCPGLPVSAIRTSPQISRQNWYQSTLLLKDPISSSWRVNSWAISKPKSISRWILLTSWDAIQSKMTRAGMTTYGYSVLTVHSTKFFRPLSLTCLLVISQYLTHIWGTRLHESQEVLQIEKTLKFVLIWRNSVNISETPWFCLAGIGRHFRMSHKAPSRDLVRRRCQTSLIGPNL